MLRAPSPHGIVPGTLVLVLQDTGSLVHLLHANLASLIPGVPVGMELLDQYAIGVLDLLE